MEENRFRNMTDRVLSVKKNRIIGVVAFFVIIVVVPIVLTIIGINAPNEKALRIDNFSDFFSDFPTEKRKEIESSLYEKVSNELDSGEVPNSGALIRSDSLYSFTLKPSFTYGNFVVDVPVIDKSYIISYTYGNLGVAIKLEGMMADVVLDVDDPKFRRLDPIEFLVPAVFDDLYCELISTTSSETKSGYAIVAVLDPPESVYLYGDTDELKDEVIEKIKSYIGSFGLSIDNYKISFKFKIVE